MEIGKEIEKQFAVSIATPWIKGKMDVDSHNIIIDIPNTVLFGLIPAGRRKHTTPLHAVSNVYTSTSYKLAHIFVGAVIVLGGISSFGSSFFSALLLLILGAVIFGSGIQTIFSYENSGNTLNIPLPFFEAHHAQEFAEKVISELNHFHDNRNVAAASQASTQSIVNAINNQNH